MILRPVTPESPCGPPMTKFPVGLMWNLTEPLTRSWGRIGSMTFSRIVLTISACDDARGVLGGDDHRIDADRRVAVVLDGDLALGVGPQPGDRAVLPQTR